MDKIKEYIPVLLAMFVSLAAVMTLLAMIEPRVFSLVPGVVPDSLFQANDDSTIRADSLSHSPALEKAPDEAGNAQAHHGAATPPGEQQPIAGKHDTGGQDSAVAAIDGGLKLPRSPAVGPDTLMETERKKMVQIFEAMEAESAAKILMNMSDAAVKQVLTTMKKRQSAKILSVLEPAQAARILKEKL